MICMAYHDEMTPFICIVFFFLFPSPCERGYATLARRSIDYICFYSGFCFGLDGVMGSNNGVDRFLYSVVCIMHDSEGKTLAKIGFDVLRFKLLLVLQMLLADPVYLHAPGFLDPRPVWLLRRRGPPLEQGIQVRQRDNYPVLEDLCGCRH